MTSLRIDVELPDGRVFSGPTLFSGSRPKPRTARVAGLQALREAVAMLPSAPDTAEHLFRESIERFVDAFLLDRRGNRDLFALAHTTGALVERTFGCAPKLNDAGDKFENLCGVLALHSRIGFSPAIRSRGHCSICKRR